MDSESSFLYVLETDQNKFQSNFSHPIFDLRLSFKARGILMYMYHHPYRSVFGIQELYANGKEYIDSETCIRSAIKELALYGYIKTIKGRVTLSSQEVKA